MTRRRVRMVLTVAVAVTRDMDGMAVKMDDMVLVLRLEGKR
jgi:hypothetical protein